MIWNQISKKTMKVQSIDFDVPEKSSPSDMMLLGSERLDTLLDTIEILVSNASKYCWIT